MCFAELSDILRELTASRTIPAIAVAVGRRGVIEYCQAFGQVYETGKNAAADSRFDIASLTKIITGICFMRLVEEGTIGLYDPIHRFFPEFNGIFPIEKDGEIIGTCDAGKITWFHALTHTTGMGWTRPKTRPSLPNLDRDLTDIYALPFAYKTGEQVLYSDIPIILMGKAMEMATQRKLDELVTSCVTKPLAMKNTGYLRLSQSNSLSAEDVIPTEYDDVFRKKRIWGEVHDENAFLLDGVAGHAGIFSTIEDMCKLGMHFNKCLNTDGILQSDTARLMIQEHATQGDDRKGLMWKLSNPDQNAYTKGLSARAYGHDGFTGCFLWNDPDVDLTIVLLSNDVYNGRQNRRLFQHRKDIIDCILRSLACN